MFKLFEWYDRRCSFLSCIPLYYSIVCIMRYKVPFSILHCLVLQYIYWFYIAQFQETMIVALILFVLYDTMCSFLSLHSLALQYCLYYAIQGVLFYPVFPCIAVLIYWFYSAIPRNDDHCAYVPSHYSIVCIIRYNVLFSILHCLVLQY